LADGKKTPSWETVAIFAAIVALWPAVIRFWVANGTSLTMKDVPLNDVMHWENAAWDYLLYAAFAVMLLVAFRRVRRLKNVRTADPKE